MPAEFRHLEPMARIYYGYLGRRPPARWSLQALFDAFPDEHSFLAQDEDAHRIALTLEDPATDESSAQAVGFYVVVDDITAEIASQDLPDAMGLPEVRQTLLQRGILRAGLDVLPERPPDLWDLDARPRYEAVDAAQGLRVSRFESIHVSEDSITRRPIIYLAFPRDETGRLARLTAEHVGRDLCVVLAGQVVFRAGIMEEIAGGTVSVSGMSAKQSEDLAAVLAKAGAR